MREASSRKEISAAQKFCSMFATLACQDQKFGPDETEEEAEFAVEVATELDKCSYKTREDCIVATFETVPIVTSPAQYVSASSSAAHAACALMHSDNKECLNNCETAATKAANAAKTQWQRGRLEEQCLKNTNAVF